MAVQENNSQISDFKIAIKSQSFATFFNTCKAWLDSSGRSSFQMGGVVFFPIPFQFGGMNLEGERLVHTYGFHIQMAAWDMDSDPASLVYCGDSPNLINMTLFTDNTTLLTGTGGLVTPAAATATLLEQKWKLVLNPTPPLDPDDPTGVTKFFKITGLKPTDDPKTTRGGAREFDLVFLEFSKFCELADIIINPAPSTTSPDYYIVGQTEGSYYEKAAIPLIDQRGIQISRATFDFDYSYQKEILGVPSIVDVDMGKTRTMKFNPYPEPRLSDYESRAAVAYQLGIPCPPIWRNGGVSKLVRAALSKGIEQGIVPPVPSLPDPPPSPPAMRSDTSLAGSFKNNKWFRLLLFLLGALLLTVVGLLCSK